MYKYQFDNACIGNSYMKYTDVEVDTILEALKARHAQVLGIHNRTFGVPAKEKGTESWPTSFHEKLRMIEEYDKSIRHMHAQLNSRSEWLDDLMRRYGIKLPDRLLVDLTEVVGKPEAEISKVIANYINVPELSTKV